MRYHGFETGWHPGVLHLSQLGYKLQLETIKIGLFRQSVVPLFSHLFLEAHIAAQISLAKVFRSTKTLHDLVHVSD